MHRLLLNKGREAQWTWLLVVLFLSIAGFWSCREKSKKMRSSAPHAETPVAEPDNIPQNSAVYRLTPEQTYRSMQSALGITLTQNTQSDPILTSFNVALGGVDYFRSRVRDSSAKVQTLLISRALAYRLASTFVSRGFGGERNQKGEDLFSKCNPNVDRPLLPEDNKLPIEQLAQIRTGARHWQDQIIEIYWRLFARPPTTEELAIIRETFQSVYLAENRSLYLAWVMTLYAILSTSEMWYT